MDKNDPRFLTAQRRHKSLRDIGLLIYQDGYTDAGDRIEKLTNLLEDVVNELDLSDGALEKHGPLGTPPAELVRLVLEEKDLRIAALKAGLTIQEQDE